MKLNSLLSFVIAGNLCALVLPASADPNEQALISNQRILLKQGAVWEKPDEDSSNKRRDLFAGPEIKGRYQYGQTLDCDFVFEVFNGGYSPKFKCSANGKKVKIKYFNGENRELFGEIAAGRLLWSLGFGADQNYLVQLNCRNCPKGDPWSWVDPRNGIIKKELDAGKSLAEIREQYRNEFVPVRHFPFVAVEVKAKGEEIGEWGWNDLDQVSAPEAQRDAFKLLMALIQHADNAAKQNVHLCPKGNLILDAKKKVTGCRQSLLYVQDLGGTFGGGGPMIHRGGAANFEKWKRTPVWKDDRTCEIYLIPAGSPSRSQLRSQVISKEGRDFLVHQIQRLLETSDLKDIFRTAGMDVGGAHPENRSATEWVNLFLEKFEEIKSAPCSAASGSDPFGLFPVN